jgi:hypothetical protein
MHGRCWSFLYENNVHWHLKGVLPIPLEQRRYISHLAGLYPAHVSKKKNQYTPMQRKTSLLPFYIAISQKLRLFSLHYLKNTKIPKLIKNIRK